MTSRDSSLDDLIGQEQGVSSFQERSCVDLAKKVRLLYMQIQERLAVRTRAVGSLLEEECSIDNRLSEVVRAYGWLNTVGEKERVELNQALRDVEKQRRRLYDESFTELAKLKADFVEALIEYRGLRRRDTALEIVNDTPALGAGGDGTGNAGMVESVYANPPEYQTR